MRHGPTVALSIALAGLVTPAVCSAAAPLATRLDFQASGGCPDAASFVARLQARTPVRLSEAADAFRLQVWLAVTAGGAQGQLSAGPLEDAEVRDVAGRDCGEVADALALIAALIVERVKQRHPEPVAREPQSVPAEPSPSARRSRASRRGLALGFAVTAGRPFDSAPVAGGAVSLLVDSWLSWWLSVAYARNDLLTEPRSAELGFGAITFGIGPHGLRLGKPLRLTAGLAAQGGFVTAKGVGVDVALAVRRSYWSAGLLARLALDLAPSASVFVDAGGFVPLVERRFVTLAPQRLAGSTSTVAPQMGLGFALQL